MLDLFVETALFMFYFQLLFYFIESINVNFVQRMNLTLFICSVSPIALESAKIDDVCVSWNDYSTLLEQQKH